MINASIFFVIAACRWAIIFWWHDHLSLDDQCIYFVILVCCWAIVFRWHVCCVLLDDQCICFVCNCCTLLGNHLLMAWSLHVAKRLMHFFFFFAIAAFHRTIRLFYGMIIVCHRMINASFLFMIVAFCKAICLLICDWCVSKGNSSFGLQLLLFVGQFIFWFAIAAFRRTIHLFWWHDRCMS